MKKSVLGFALLFSLRTFAQNPEFAKSGNGLIYSDVTISQLRHIVDSLNIKFRICDLHKVYLAKAQARGNYISLDDGDIKAARRDIENHISYDEFVKKYPKAESSADLLVVRYIYKDYDDKDAIEFSNPELDGSDGYSILFEENINQYKRPLKGKWVFDYQKKSKDSDESLEGFYFTTEFEAMALPEKYARMVQYSDCMVDTSVEIFKEKAKRTGVRYLSSKSSNRSAVNEFLKYIHQKTARPEFTEEYTEATYEKYWQKFKIWDSLRYEKIDQLKENNKEFTDLLQAAIKEALDDASASDDEFEQYVSRYDSPKIALELKRSRIVVGGCSMDNSPRVHAMNIALLSAETVNWEIFLRSHLDIMNDNFARVSDGSWAWAGRKTYIKELEVLDINVIDLLLGISLRVENPGDHHYYGSIGRLGRALSESEEKENIEKKILEMISDSQLDDYNRVLMYYLFLNYNHYVENEDERKQNIEKLKLAVNTLPGYISQKIVFK